MWISKGRNFSKRLFNFRAFSTVNTEYYDGSESQQKFAESFLQRYMLTIKKMDEERYFHHEKKEAKYDKKTGKIVLIDTNVPEPKKIIRNFDDLQKEKERLREELKLKTEDVLNSNKQELAERYRKLYHITEEGYEIDRSDFYSESQDHMRID